MEYYPIHAWQKATLRDVIQTKQLYREAKTRLTGRRGLAFLGLGNNIIECRLKSDGRRRELETLIDIIEIERILDDIPPPPPRITSLASPPTTENGGRSAERQVAPVNIISISEIVAQTSREARRPTIITDPDYDGPSTSRAHAAVRRPRRLPGESTESQPPPAPREKPVGTTTNTDVINQVTTPPVPTAPVVKAKTARRVAVEIETPPSTMAAATETSSSAAAAAAISTSLPTQLRVTLTPTVRIVTETRPKTATTPAAAARSTAQVNTPAATIRSQVRWVATNRTATQTEPLVNLRGEPAATATIATATATTATATAATQTEPPATQEETTRPARRTTGRRLFNPAAAQAAITSGRVFNPAAARETILSGRVFNPIARMLRHTPIWENRPEDMDMPVPPAPPRQFIRELPPSPRLRRRRVRMRLFRPRNPPYHNEDHSQR